MQKNPLQNSSDELATIKFFSFELEAISLKQILDFYAWFLIAEIILMLAIALLFDRFNVGGIYGDLYLCGVIGTLGFCIYRYRYSPYMHGLIIIAYGYSFGEKINYLKKFKTDSYLIEKFKNIIFNEGSFASIHDFFAESLCENISYYFNSFIMSLIFFYFAYSYKKLNKRTN